MIVAQITDPHCVRRGELLYKTADSNGAFRAALQALKHLRPQPTYLLLSGDLVEDGSVEAYEALREIVEEELEQPPLIIPGNHDNRANLRQVFGDWDYIPSDGFIQYVIDDAPLRLIALDSLEDGKHYGRLCDKRLSWLKQTLESLPPKPTLLFLHHPPIETGIWWMDGDGLFGRGALQALVNAHPEILHITCGHVHRAMSSRFGSATLTVAPSTCFQIHLDLEPEAPPRVILEPAALTVHRFEGDNLTSHLMTINPDPKPIDITDQLGDWASLRQQIHGQLTALRSELPTTKQAK